MISELRTIVNNISNVTPTQLFRLTYITLKNILRNSLNDNSYNISDTNFLKQFNCQNKERFIGLFETNFKEKFFYDPLKIYEIIDVFKKEYKPAIPKIIDQGNDYCNHIFDILGSGRVKLDKQIDWHLDFKSGFRWDPKEKFVGTLNFLNLKDDSDVKVPWELSRCQHFVTLGRAYWLTKDEKYAEEFVKEIESWIDNNDIGLGVNWASTMDVAIRAVNWLWGFCFFIDSKRLTNEFKLKFLKNLYIHGKFIRENLEIGFIKSNHYLSNIVGVIFLGILFPPCKDTNKWIKFGCKALEEEIEFQVHPDGVDFEASIGYHRLVTELFLTSVLLCRKNNIDLSELILKRLEKMIEFVMYYTKPNGLSPLIGDADNGRLQILSDNDINDHRYLLSIGASVFGRTDFKNTYNKFDEEAFWLLGNEGLHKFKNIHKKKQKLTSKGFRNSGFYVMRDNDLYLIIHCGDVGVKGIGAHGHCDCLSFELFAGDKTFIVDPGTYAYAASPKWRNHFRSTKYHNTVVVDNEEINRFNENELFKMNFDAIPKLNKWQTTEKNDFFDGEHSGYRRLKNPVIHRRQIHFNKQRKHWVIRDILTGNGKHKFEWYFHFAPIELEKVKESIIKTRCKGTNIKLEPIKVPKGLSCDIIEGWISKGYGKKEKAPVVKYKLNKDLTKNDIVLEFKISVIKR